MKKLLATLLVSTMALSAIGGLVACGGDDDNKAPAYKDPFAGTVGGTWSVPTEDSYWLAGGYALHGSHWEDTTSPEGLKFEQNSENENLYRLKLDLIEGDQFKVRFENLGWDDEAGVSKLTADINLLKSLRDGEIKPEVGGMGGSNFVVYEDGQYEIRINTAPKDASVVTYVRLGDPVNAPETDSYEWMIMGGGVKLNNWGADDIQDAEDAATGTVFTKGADGVNTLTIELAVDDVFKFTVVGKGWGVELNATKVEGELGPNFGRGVEDDGSENTNLRCLVAGTYKFTIDKKGKTITIEKQ